MPGLYDSQGLRFQFPENWRVDDADSTNERVTVSVTSPGGGFWTVVVYPCQDEPGRLAADVLAAMRNEYHELDAEPVEDELAGQSAVGFDIHFYCLDLTNTAAVREFELAGRTVVVLWQAEDREFDQIGEVFEAMTVSLLR